MRTLAFLLALFAVFPVYAHEEWQWVKVINNAATGWQSETGSAQVLIKGKSFDVKLFWGPAKTADVRITLKGTITKSRITARETILETDIEPSKYTGKYEKQMWNEPFQGAVGTEAITLSDGYNMIGLRRNIAK